MGTPGDLGVDVHLDDLGTVDEVVVRVHKVYRFWDGPLRPGPRSGVRGVDTL